MSINVEREQTNQFQKYEAFTKIVPFVTVSSHDSASIVKLRKGDYGPTDQHAESRAGG